MNNAFTKGKFKKWYGSRFYKSCLTPNLSYYDWLSMQPKHFIYAVLGKSSGDEFIIGHINHYVKNKFNGSTECFAQNNFCRKRTPLKPNHFMCGLSLVELKARQKL